MKKKSKFKVLINVLFIIGIVLVSYPLIKNTFTLIKIQSTTVEISANLPTTKQANENITLPTLESYMTVSTQTLTPAIGELTIPDQKMNIPIFAGLTNQEMLFGVGAMYPERALKNNNIVLLGHHLSVEDVLLGKLKTIKVGAEIFMTYLTENVKYQVVEKKVVAQTDLSVLENTKESRLTLITCDKPSATDKRLVVVAELVEDKSVQPKKIEKTEWHKKMMQRSYIKYSLIPMIIVGLIIILGSYAIWKYV